MNEEKCTIIKETPVMPMTIEQARLAHLPEIERITQESSPDPWGMATLRRCLDSLSDCLYIAVDNGRILGYVVFHTQVLPEAELYNVVVDKAVRRQGVGTFLLNYVLTECATRGAEKIFLEVRASNKKAQALYRAHGFVQIDIRRGYYNNPIEDAIIMEKTL